MDEGERKAWICAVPNADLSVTNDTVVCELHWPSDFKTVSKKGRSRPKFPPSVFPNVPPGQIPTPAPPPRSTKRTEVWTVYGLFRQRRPQSSL